VGEELGHGENHNVRKELRGKKKDSRPGPFENTTSKKTAPEDIGSTLQLNRITRRENKSPGPALFPFHERKTTSTGLQAENRFWWNEEG